MNKILLVYESVFDVESDQDERIKTKTYLGKIKRFYMEMFYML